MRKFDEALAAFSYACRAAAHWKDFFGAAYRTRLDTAFAEVKKAYEFACQADDEELNRPPAPAVHAEVDRLREDCAEAYQVIGALAYYAGMCDNPGVIKALDNLSAASDARPRPHADLLPFPKDPAKKATIQAIIDTATALRDRIPDVLGLTHLVLEPSYAEFAALFGALKAAESDTN